MEPEGGELVFAGTRIPARNLVDYDKVGHILDDFPGVGREQAEGYLEMSRKATEGRARFWIRCCRDGCSGHSEEFGHPHAEAR